MQRMRINLETYLERQLAEKGVTVDTDEPARPRGIDFRNHNLNDRIRAFSLCPGVNEEFARSMHRIRELGNSAAHYTADGPSLSQQDCQLAVRRYRECKHSHTINQSRVEQNYGVVLEASEEDQVSQETMARQATEESVEESEANSNHSTVHQKNKKRKNKKKKGKKR